MTIPTTPPRDIIGELRSFDPDSDEQLQRLDWVLSTPWKCQEQPVGPGRTKAIVYAGDAHDATLIVCAENASDTALDVLRYIVASHNAAIADRIRYTNEEPTP